MVEITSMAIIGLKLDQINILGVINACFYPDRRNSCKIMMLQRSIRTIGSLGLCMAE